MLNRLVRRGKVEEPKEPSDALAGWPILHELIDADTATASDTDVGIHHVSLYLDKFSSKYLPFLKGGRICLPSTYCLMR